MKKLIFVIDSSDKNRIDEAKKELYGILDLKQFSKCDVLILANKQDVFNCFSPSELIDKLELRKLKQNFTIQPCTATDGTGILLGFNWLGIKEI